VHVLVLTIELFLCCLTFLNVAPRLTPSRIVMKLFQLLCKRISITWFQTSAAKQIRTALFWAITQRVVVFS